MSKGFKSNDTCYNGQIIERHEDTVGTVMQPVTQWEIDHPKVMSFSEKDRREAWKAIKQNQDPERPNTYSIEKRLLEHSDGGSSQARYLLLNLRTLDFTAPD